MNYSLLLGVEKIPTDLRETFNKCKTEESESGEDSDELKPIKPKQRSNS